MPAVSLYDLAKKRLIQNIHMLEDIGDLPYSFLAPVLKHIQIPDQLAELEETCPQIVGETGEIWLRFIERDIPGWEKKPHQPRDPKNWSKVYKKLKKDAEREDNAQKEMLKGQLQALQKDRKANQTAIVDPRVGYTARPRRFGTSSGWSNPAAPAKTGKMAFDKLRRGIYDQNKATPKALRMPAHILAERKKATVTQAPARLVRIMENEVPKRMVLSKRSSAGALDRSVSAVHRTNITQRPAPRPSEPPAQPKQPERTRLPTGQQFTAPKPTRPPTAQPQKRSRGEHSVLYQPKRRKV